MFKKTIFTIFISFILLFSFQSFAQEDLGAIDKKVNVYFFWGDGCPHCANEKPFLNKLEKENDFIDVYSYEVWINRENLELLTKIGKKIGINVSGVPVTIVGDEAFVGYSEGYTSSQIESRAKFCSSNDCKDSVASLAGLDSEEIIIPEEQLSLVKNVESPSVISLPFVGSIDMKDFSLPILTIILGGLDGFNPCAMWTLIFLISLLLGMENKKRMWILGSTFIVTSAFVYFMFMVAWLNLLIFIGFIVWVRWGIGALALVGGGYNVREYFIGQPGCKVTGTEKRQAIFEKLKKITQENSFWLAFVGIILLAFAVNLVELICSAGIPAVYTQVLALNNLSTFQYYMYIILYIFVFMLDDLAVFFIAMYTLQTVGITTKYTRWSHLIGGILMLIIGFLLILRPDILMF